MDPTTCAAPTAHKQLMNQAIHWDISKSAGSLVTLTTLICAITVAAIILVVPLIRRKATDQASKSLILLPVVLFTSLLSSFMYAVTSAESDCKRAYSEGLLASIPFALGVLALFLALTWLIHLYEGPDTIPIRWVVRAAFFALVIAVGLFFTILLNAVAVAASGAKWLTFFSSPPLYLMLVPATIIGLSLSVRGGHADPGPETRAFVVVNILTLLVSLAAAGKFVLIAYSNGKPTQSTVFPDWLRWTLIAGLAAAFFLFVDLIPPIVESTASGGWRRRAREGGRNSD